MSTPSEAGGQGLTITIPYGDSQRGATAVFAGGLEQVRRGIVSFFGIDREAVSGLTLSELVVNATQLAQAKGAIAATLGGTVIEGSAVTDSRSAASGDEVWAAASVPAEPAPEGDPLVERITQAGDIPALQRIWAENQGAFSDPQVMAAWKARGRALQQAA